MSERGDGEILPCCSSGVSRSTPSSASMEESPEKKAEPAVSYDNFRWRRQAAHPGVPYFPYHAPVGRSSGTGATIQRVESCLPSIARTGDLMSIAAPTAVSIGPYHYYHWQLVAMEDSKRAAQAEFCRVASLSQSQPPLEVEAAVREKMLSLAASARTCYACDRTVDGTMSNEHLADMMFLDGCFLLQFMVSMCPDDPDAPPEADPLISRAEVHTRIDAIARDVMLLENQIPWVVLQALMDLRPGVPVDRFLALMASAFTAGNDDKAAAASLSGGGGDDPPPPHLLGLFHSRQVGAARTQSLRAPRLSSLSTTAVELAEMGVKLTVTKTKKFGDMSMEKRRPWHQDLLRLGLSGGKLSLAPLVLSNLTACWLLNMAAYEACLGHTKADNFAVSSYVSLVSCLVNREEDVQELRAKGIINSAFCDMGTLQFFKWAAADLRVGHRFYQVFQGLQEYRQERWVWISIHRFLYKNYKTAVAVLSIVGVLAGLFKTILLLKQHQ